MTAGPSGFAGVSDTSSSLLRRVKTHNAEAWDRLVKLYGPLAYIWTRGAGLQASDAADVGQETFAAVWRNIAEFRHQGPTDSFRGWLWTITRSKIRDRFRRLQNQPQAPGGTAGQGMMAQVSQEAPASSAPPFASGEGAAVARRTLELVRTEFEPPTWQAFWQTAVEGRVPADVAEELGMTRQAVYKAKSRVLLRVRQELEGLELCD